MAVISGGQWIWIPGAEPPAAAPTTGGSAEPNSDAAVQAQTPAGDGAAASPPPPPTLDDGEQRRLGAVGSNVAPAATADTPLAQPAVPPRTVPPGAPPTPPQYMVVGNPPATAAPTLTQDAIAAMSVRQVIDNWDAVQQAIKE